MQRYDNRPIGVFDSGIGGLTVLKALIERLPRESTVYLGDTARVPYGTKSADVVTRYSVQNARFLIEKDIKLLVVACNTASSVGLPALAEALSVPVVGVIEPGARAAAAHSRSGQIAVLGTQGTVRSGAYQRALAQARPGAIVHTRACPLFVPLVEEGWVAGDVPRMIARAYLDDLAANDALDTVVLGCTHYPLLREVIASVFGPHVTLVDGGVATAERVAEELLSSAAPAEPTHEPSRAYFVTDVPERFVEVGARFLGHAIGRAEQVDVRF